MAVGGVEGVLLSLQAIGKILVFMCCLYSCHCRHDHAPLQGFSQTSLIIPESSVLPLSHQIMQTCNYFPIPKILPLTVDPLYLLAPCPEKFNVLKFSLPCAFWLLVKFASVFESTGQNELTSGKTIAREVQDSNPRN